MGDEFAPSNRCAHKNNIIDTENIPDRLGMF